MKKFIALALALVMLAALAVPAFAFEDQTDSTLVTYTVGESYVFEVPATLTVGGAAGNIEVSDYNVLSTNKVQVSVEIAAWTLGAGEDAKAFKLNELTANGVIASFEDDGTEALTATFVAGAPAVAGTYTQTANFTAAIVARS